MRRHRNGKNGFSLIEVLLVLAILGIISTIAIPSYLGQRRRARVIGDAQTNAQVLRMALESRKAENGVYGAAGTYTWTNGTPSSSHLPSQLHTQGQFQDELQPSPRFHRAHLHAYRAGPDRGWGHNSDHHPDRIYYHRRLLNLWLEGFHLLLGEGLDHLLLLRLVLLLREGLQGSEFITFIGV